MPTAPTRRLRTLYDCHERAFELHTLLKAAGFESPYAAPNSTPAQLWSSAVYHDLVSEAEELTARILYGDRWSYTGD